MGTIPIMIIDLRDQIIQENSGAIKRQSRHKKYRQQNYVFQCVGCYKILPEVFKPLIDQDICYKCLEYTNKDYDDKKLSKRL